MNLITGNDLCRTLAIAGTKPFLERHTDDKVMEGRYSIERTLTGIQLHIMDAQELTEANWSLLVPPGLTFGVVLAGGVEFNVDNASHVISASLNQENTANCFAMNLLRHTSVTRGLRKDTSICKLYITVSHKWLEQHLNLEENIDNRLFHYIRQQHGLFKWQGSAQLIHMANKIVCSSDKHGVFDNLFKESEIIRLLSVFLKELQTTYLDREESNSIFVENLLRTGVGKISAERIKQFIDDRLFSTTSNLANIRVETIASELSLSTRSMQRIFKHYYSQTVFDYIRQHRLAIARDALINGDVSIGEAAYLAGYKHSSNFANAFKEAFGVAPGNLRTSMKHRKILSFDKPSEQPT